MIEAIRVRGMGMAKRKGEKVGGERNFAGRRKIGREKRGGTKVYVHARVRECMRVKRSLGREELTGETDLYCAMCSSVDVSRGIRT